MWYVKVVNGKIVNGPSPISSSPSDSPNIQWGKDQMKLNNLFFVDLTCDPKTQKVDLANPIITSDSVSFPIISKTASDIQADLVANYNQTIMAAYLAQGITVQTMLLALWQRVVEGNKTPSDNMEAQRLAIQTTYPTPTGDVLPL